MQNRRLFSLQGDTDVSLSSKAPRFISKYIVKQLQYMCNIEEDLTRLPSLEEHFFITAEQGMALYLFAIMISKREVITRLSYFTNSITIAEYNALVEIKEKYAIGHLTILTSVKPVFVSDSVNIKIKVASFSGEILLATTLNNHYVFESSALGKVEDTFHFLTIANDKRVLEFKESILTNHRLKYE